MPRPKKNNLSQTETQSSSAPVLPLAPFKGFEHIYPHYLPCVEHCINRIASTWANQYDKKKYDAMASRFCQKASNHPQLKTFTIFDNKVLLQLADEIEKEVLSGIVIHNEESF